ncbi:MAG: ABC transporter permease [Cereibacter sphaeroides]|uniref:ABC transporter permease n=1 Tax=Cereibacter sphaeroides TaxID=1063 RepID=A0A2W5TQH3_CERSP|nr:MAG: ABC transporter permease [Cereibacter sphaeroides]
MFRPNVRKTALVSAFTLFGVIFHASVRNLRKSHRNAALGLLINILQSVMFVALFLLIFNILGLRNSPLRGDYILYIMSGVFMYMTHVKAMGAVSGAATSTSPMMLHAPMNPIVSICAAALSTLYTQVLSAGVILFTYHVIWTPITIDQPVGTILMLLLAWISGCAIGMIFMAARPWNPAVIGMIVLVYQRLNMIASGKMFVANTMPTFVLAWFDWNPLFHIIDQTRGFVFLNYSPHYSSISYPVKVTLVCILIGLMGQFYTSRHASISWAAKG